MFLKTLSDEEGELFLELLAFGLKRHGTLTKGQQGVIDSYKGELSLPDYTVHSVPYEQVASALLHSSKQVKRSILIELSLSFFATDYSSKEDVAWLLQFASNIGIDQHEAERMIQWCKDFSDFIEVAVMYINSK